VVVGVATTHAPYLARPPRLLDAGPPSMSTMHTELPATGMYLSGR
jgi:hypothetical protein